MSERTLKEWRGYFTPLTLTPAEEVIESLAMKSTRSACIDVQTIIDLAESRISELQAELEGYYDHETELNQDIKDLKDVVEPQKERISKLQGELKRKQHKIDKGIGLIKKLQDMWQTYKQGFELAKTELATANAALVKCKTGNPAPDCHLQKACHTCAGKFNCITRVVEETIATLTPPDADKCKTEPFDYQSLVYQLCRDVEQAYQKAKGLTVDKLREWVLMSLKISRQHQEPDKPECKTCGGKGQKQVQVQVYDADEDDYDIDIDITPCPDCNPDSTEKGKNDESK